MIIILSYNNKILLSKEVIYSLNKHDLYSENVEDHFGGNSLNWLIKTFKENFNIDINNYSLHQIKQSKNSITIEMSHNDLQKWRNERLKDLGIV